MLFQDELDDKQVKQLTSIKNRYVEYGPYVMIYDLDKINEDIKDTHLKTIAMKLLQGEYIKKIKDNSKDKNIKKIKDNSKDKNIKKIKDNSKDKNIFSLLYNKNFKGTKTRNKCFKILNYYKMDKTKLYVQFKLKLLIDGHSSKSISLNAAVKANNTPKAKKPGTAANASAAKAEKNTAATKIQKIVRGRKNRKNLAAKAEKNTAATKIQKIVRGRKNRKNLASNENATNDDATVLKTQEGGDSIKIMSWNIYYKVYIDDTPPTDDKNLHRAKIETYIVETNPDILCVQESVMKLDNYDSVIVKYPVAFCTTLWKRDKYDFIESYTTCFSKTAIYKSARTGLTKEQIETFTDEIMLNTYSEKVDKVENVILGDSGLLTGNNFRPLIFTILKDKKDKHILIGNFWLMHKDRVEYELLNAFINRMLNVFKSKYTLSDIILTGDWNEYPNESGQGLSELTGLQLINNDDKTCCGSENLSNRYNEQHYLGTNRFDLMFSNMNKTEFNVLDVYYSDHKPIIASFNTGKNYGYDFDGVVHTHVYKILEYFKDANGIPVQRHPIRTDGDNFEIVVLQNLNRIFEKTIECMKKNITDGDNVFIISSNSNSLKDRILALLTDKGVDIDIKHILMDKRDKIECLKANRIYQFVDDSWGHIVSIYDSKKLGNLPDLELLKFAVPEIKKYYDINFMTDLDEQTVGIKAGIIQAQNSVDPVE
jgi:hypothetical protein